MAHFRTPICILALAVLSLGVSGGLSVDRARAASADGQYAIKEAGAQPCSRFVTERDKRSNAYFSFVGWTAGYVSLYNRLTPDTTDVMSWQTIELVDLLLYNYCKKNPDVRYLTAVETLVRALHPTRLRNPSEIVSITGGERPIQLYKDVIRRIQQTLTERGMYKGGIDGDFGPGTKEALKKFQAEMKLPETGLPDQITLLRLFQ